jgi:hypothetical protein
VCATCSTHHILLDFITVIALCDAYELWSSSLYSLLQPPNILICRANLLSKVSVFNTA